VCSRCGKIIEVVVAILRRGPEVSGNGEDGGDYGFKRTTTAAADGQVCARNGTGASEVKLLGPGKRGAKRGEGQGVTGRWGPEEARTKRRRIAGDLGRAGGRDYKARTPAAGKGALARTARGRAAERGTAATRRAGRSGARAQGREPLARARRGGRGSNAESRGWRMGRTSRPRSCASCPRRKSRARRRSPLTPRCDASRLAADAGR